MKQPVPSERSTHTDSLTGATVIQWTAGRHKNQHLYFTSLSVTADDRWLVFISDRSGNPNLHAIDRRDGTIRQLSRNESGLLRSYVYPLGGLRGLSKSSPVLDPQRKTIYYIRDDTVYGVALDDEEASERRICAIPPKWYSAFTHISPDGKTLCVPCTDPRAFVDKVDSQWDQLLKVPARMAAEGLLSRVYLIDTASGETRVHAEVPFWVSHVQFDPAGTGRIIFNKEGFKPGTTGPLPDRIWCLELDGSFHPIAPEPADEWRCHENWSTDGRSVVYHGNRGGKPFLAARTWEGKLLGEKSLEGIAFWHATGALDGRLFVDRHDGVISVVDLDAKDNAMVDLCRHDTSMKDQDTHAHPITTPNGKSVIFTSDRSGNCNVYEVLLDGR